MHKDITEKTTFQNKFDQSISDQIDEMIKSVDLRERNSLINDFEKPHYIRDQKFFDYIPEYPKEIEYKVLPSFLSPVSGSLANNTNNVAKLVYQQVNEFSDRFKIYDYRQNLQGIDYKNRINICGVLPIENNEVEIWENDKIQQHYKNLMSCGSVWGCPVCRFKIMSRRAVEIQNILSNAQLDGNSMGFLTLTIQHDCTTDFDIMVKKVGSTFRKILAQRKFREIVGSVKLDFIRTVECNFSKFNSFHPHMHIVLIAKCESAKLEMIADSITEHWITYFQGATSERQTYKPVFNVNDGIEYLSLSEYISKSNLSHELTNKTCGKRSGSEYYINPLNIGQMISEGSFSEYSLETLQDIYTEYYRITKGVRVHSFSKGLKLRYLTIIEKTDSEILSDTTELVVYNFTLTQNTWKQIKLKRAFKLFLLAVEMHRKDISGSYAKLEIQLSQILCKKVYITDDQIIQL